jgi:hypothetical protein
MKRNTLFIIVIVLGLLLFVGCSCESEKGLLQGKVSIGPISPVEQPGQTTTIRCDVYDVRKIMIYDKNRTNLIKQIDIDCNSEENYARYRVELEPGIYIIDINHIGIDFSKDVPKQVEIEAGLTTRLDIDIDTGIR